MEQIQAEWARRKLDRFIQFGKPDYVADRFHLELCRVVERFHADVLAGRSPRDIIVAPPQHGKSTVVSRYYPSWGIGRSPHLHWIGCSYNQDWADGFCRDVQNILESESCRKVFPEVRLPVRGSSRVKRLEDYFELAPSPAGRRYDGRYKAVGRGGGATGRSAHVLLIDDPFKDAAEAMSETIRASAWEWYTQALRTRVQKGGGILVIATRWHEDDLIGKLIEQSRKGGESWRVHHFPAISPESGCDWRARHEALSPSRFGLSDLLAIKGTLSGAAWSALYDGSPVALEGNILPADKWKYYTVAPDLRQFDFLVQTWDATFKDSAGSDFCAGQVWGCRGAERWLLDYILEKMSYPRFKEAMRQMSYKWAGTSWKFVEDKANGPAVISELQSEIGGICAVDPQGGKIARAWAASADLCAGNCYIPDPSIAPWVGDFVRRCAQFPGNINVSGSDDDIDAFTQMINQMRLRQLGVLEHNKQEQTKIQEAEKLQKPVISPQAPHCPECDSQAVARVAGQWRCNQCGKQFGGNPPAFSPISRNSLEK